MLTSSEAEIDGAIGRIGRWKVGASILAAIAETRPAKTRHLLEEELHKTGASSNEPLN